jgi:hypothetical protein
MEKYFDSEPYCDEVVSMLRQLQADLSDLQRHIPAKQLTVNEVMAEHCTCYKLGYSPLNDYASVKQK